MKWRLYIKDEDNSLLITSSNLKQKHLLRAITSFYELLKKNNNFVEFLISCISETREKPYVHANFPL